MTIAEGIALALDALVKLTPIIAAAVTGDSPTAKADAYAAIDALFVEVQSLRARVLADDKAAIDEATR